MATQNNSTNKESQKKARVKLGPVEAEGREKFVWKILALVVLAVILIVLVSPLGRERLRLLRNSTNSGGLQVMIFFPDPTRADGKDGAPYQDGFVQHQAFNSAIKQFQHENPQYIRRNEPILETYYFRPRETDKDKRPLSARLTDKMKKSYDDKKARIFLVTMSSAIESVTPDFIKWRAECIDLHKEPPILIATVASAPGLADSRNGIYRLYIRSTEESVQLANYLAWAHKVQICGVFYITRTEGRDDEAYGRGARIAFAERWQALGLGRPQFYDVTSDTSNAKTQISEFMRIVKNNTARVDAPKFGAFVVGYGNMFKTTLDELISQGFQGPIVCASTLTVPSWQPSEDTADQRIFTVMPKCPIGIDTLAPNERNVIYLIAQATLLKTMHCAAEVRTTDKFAISWPHTNGVENKISIEYLANGDTIISVNVVGMDVWRYRGHE